LGNSRGCHHQANNHQRVGKGENFHSALLVQRSFTACLVDRVWARHEPPQSFVDRTIIARFVRLCALAGLRRRFGTH
jgi:hypothetical protein